MIPIARCVGSAVRTTNARSTGGHGVVRTADPTVLPHDGRIPVDDPYGE